MRVLPRALLASLLAAATPLLAQPACKVLDPELQQSYAGPCVDGLAEGYGHASGIAQYSGEFKAGRKHGRGVKRWPSGDRYEGLFQNDAKHGAGVYEWGRGPWQGERYEGAFLNDQRNGYGIYRWPTGDVYAGPWEKDVMTGPPTEMMRARAKFEEEARKAVAREGQAVCRAMPVGLAGTEWIRGVVAAVAKEQVAVRIERAGLHPHAVNNVVIRAGEIVWDAAQAWTPCL